jgi:hypothetical protein
MAISANASILAMLKVYYKDGVENLMFRNSPVLKKIKKERVEGKTQNFSAMYGRGGAVGGNFKKAEQAAATVSKAVEFVVEPGQIFSVYDMNSKEVQASQTKRGAYMKIAGAKMFAASESFRKTLAAALYGSGYGELCMAPAATFVGTDPVDITLPNHAIMAIDIGSVLEVKASVKAASPKIFLEVTGINGTTVTVRPTEPASSVTLVTTDVICLDGSHENGASLLPVGLAGWLPTKRNDLGTTFMGVNIRSVAPDRLAGVFYDASAINEKKSVSVQKLLQRCRRMGSQADLIIMNDEDFLEFSNEIESNNTYFTQTSTKESKKASVGFKEFSASFSTNYIENIVDDPYCPKGRFYILDSEYVALWSYTNTDKVNDGIEGNNPGKQNPMEMDGEGKTETPYGLIIDDYLNIQPGTSTINGPAMEVTLQMFGSFVVTNPSVCGVGLFYGATGIA